MGLAGSRAGSQWRGSIPIPPTSLQAPGLCATHIVGVIILIVGQLHHPVGALERGTAMGNQLRTVQKKTKNHPSTKLGSRLLCKPSPMGTPQSWWATLGVAGCMVWHPTTSKEKLQMPLFMGGRGNGEYE